MKSIIQNAARARFDELLEAIHGSHDPIRIVGKKHNAILVSEEKWRAVNETLNFLSVSGMRESIRRGLKVDVRECSKKLKW